MAARWNLLQFFILIEIKNVFFFFAEDDPISNIFQSAYLILAFLSFFKECESKVEGRAI